MLLISAKKHVSDGGLLLGLRMLMMRGVVSILFGGYLYHFSTVNTHNPHNPQQPPRRTITRTTRLETRTKESTVCVSVWVIKARARSESKVIN